MSGNRTIEAILTWSTLISLNICRFHKVAEMLDISNLKIQIKIKPLFLSKDVNYGVNLIFRFCGPIKSKAKRVYVNLKYKNRGQTLHAYFATWREDDWMMIELCRFLNDKEDIDFEFLLESFSRCYCESGVIYIEGIEFRAIDYASLKILFSSHSIFFYLYIETEKVVLTTFRVLGYTF